MGSRHRSREAALKVLYQADLLKENDYPKLVEEVCADNPKGDSDRGFIQSLVAGVFAHLPEIDSKLEKLSENWDLNRLGYLERAILRMALYEMEFDITTPAKVSIDEAIELAKAYCEPESAGFINGVLDKALKNKADSGS